MKRELLVWSLGVLLVQSLPALELLSDPGFEDANPNAMNFGWRRHHSLTQPGAVVVAQQGAHGGRNYLQLRIPPGHNESAVYQPLRLPDLKKHFVLSVWARGSGELLMYVYQSRVETVGGNSSATDLAQFKMGEQKTVNMPSLCNKVKLSPEWKRYEFTLTPDPKATALSAAFHVWNGTADIDDASLVLKGDKADEMQGSLQFRELKGCSYDNGVLRPYTRSTQPAGSTALVMEAEYARHLSLAERGGIRPDEKASCGQYLDFANGITFEFDLGTGGVYQAWYRASIPTAANWSHGESMDGESRQNQDATPNDGWQADTWSWRPGPLYTLKAGSHNWTFNNWHGGIRLDQVALLPPGAPPPSDGSLLPPSPVTVATSVEAVSTPVKPFALKAWRRVVLQQVPAQAMVACEWSSNAGQTWNPMPKNLDLSAVAAATHGELSIRLHLSPANAPASSRASDLTSIVNPAIAYVPGSIPEFTVRGPNTSFQIKGLGGRLCNLRNVKTGVAYDLPDNQGQPLFALTERKVSEAGRLETLSSLDGQLQDARVVKTKAGQETFVFSYSLNGGEILVKGELESGDTELIRGRLKVEYRGSGEIVAVDFPLLSNLAIGGDAKDDTLIVPFTQGWKIPHPASQSFSNPRYWTWPGMLSMCYVDLYDIGNNAGLYFSSYDDSFSTTELLPQGSVDGAVLGLGLRKWIRIKKGQTYELPEVVIGLHAGDWHWGADRYREWAQGWFRKGNTPRWFRESDGYVTGGPLWNGPFDQHLLDTAVKCAGNGSGLVATWGYMATMNGACGVYPLPSPWYGGINNFRWTNRKIHELGAHANYYIQGHLVNPGYNRDNTFLGNLPRAYVSQEDWKVLPDRDFFRRNRIIAPDGSAPPPYLHQEIMCDSSKREFNAYLSDWALKFLHDYQADGIYFDGFAIGSAYPSINYDDDQSTAGDWGRGQLRMIRRCKEEGRKINPDVVFGMEGCSDVYQQFGDWGLMGNNNALEMFRYTFPDLIVVGGSANGNAEVAVENVFMNGYRMNEMMHDADKDKTQAGGLAGKGYDYLRPWAGRVAAIRKIINPFLLRARFMDTVGVRAAADIDARLMLRDAENNKGALVLIHNRKETKGKTITVSTVGWGPVRAAWLVTWQGIKPLAGKATRDAWEFEIPADKYAAALLINESEPLVDKRLLPLGLPAGMTVTGAASVLNVNREPMALAFRVTGPLGFGGEAVKIKAEPGIISPVTVGYSANANAKTGERVDLLLETAWRSGWFGTKRMDWLLPARVVGPLDARMKRTGARELLLTLKNRSNRPLGGHFKIAMEATHGTNFEPASGAFTVAAMGSSEIKITADLGKLEVPESAVAKLTLATGEEEEAYACVGPFCVNADFEQSNFGLSQPLADGGSEYDRLFAEEGGGYNKLDRAPRIVFQGAYRGKGCLMVPKGGPAHITWNVWLPPNKKYKVSIAIKRTVPEGGGFSMSMASDICAAPWLGNTKAPKLNEWEIFEGEFKSINASPYWQAVFHASPFGDVYYDALEIKEIP